MRRLWLKMTEMYGPKWTSSMGEVPNKSWCDACRVFGEAEWKNAIATLNLSTDAWPPSLPEFRRWAYLGKTSLEAKEHSARRADDHVQKIINRYNPNCAGITNQEADKLRDRLARSYYVDELDRERSAAMGIAHEERDPLRICPDPEYR
jgi:hypothetical protein